MSPQAASVIWMHMRITSFILVVYLSNTYYFRHMRKMPPKKEARTRGRAGKAQQSKALRRYVAPQFMAILHGF